MYKLLLNNTYIIQNKINLSIISIFVVGYTRLFSELTPSSVIRVNSSQGPKNYIRFQGLKLGQLYAM